MAKSVVGTFVKVLLIIGIPVAALAWVSSAAGKSGGGKLEPKPLKDVPSTLKAWADKWLAGPGSAPEDDGPKPVPVGWFFYAMRWILVEEYADPAPTIEDESSMLMHGPLGRLYTYTSRFRWIVVHGAPTDDAPPFGMGDVTASGEAPSLGGSGEPAIEAARLNAANNAANEAAKWIDVINKGN